MTDPATITLNGVPYPISGPLSVAMLLQEIGYSEKPVVVELNEQAVSPRDHPRTQVNPGDRLEIVALAAGG
jgi:sulfur carrier protein